MPSSKNSLFYSTLMLMGVGVVSQLLGFIYRIFLSRLIGAENMGLYQLVMQAYFIIMSVCLIGLTAAVSKLSAEYAALGRHRAVRQLVGLCVLRFLRLFLPVAASVWLFSGPISENLLGDERTRLGLVLLLPVILLTGIENIQKSTFYGIGEVVPPASVELVEQIIRSGSVILLLVLLPARSDERTVGYIITGMIFAEIFSAVTITLVWRKRFESGGSGSEPPAGDMARRVRSIAVPIGMTSLIGNLMSSATSILIPQRLAAAGMGAAQAMAAFGAMFGMALPLVMMPFTLINAMYIVLVPRVAESAALGRMDEVNRRTRKAMEATSVMMLPALAFLVVTGPALGRLLFQEQAAGDFLLPLAAGVFLICQKTVLGGVLNGIGCQKFTAGASILSEGVQLVFTFVGTGIPGVGLKGFLWGFVISSFINFLLCFIRLRRKTGLRLPVLSWLVSPALGSVLTGLCVRLLFRLCLDRGLPAGRTVLGCLVFAMLFYLSLMRIQGASPFKTFYPKRAADSGPRSVRQ